MAQSKIIRYIDLFAGLGGTRIGFEDAIKKNNLIAQCVFTSEIKPHAIKVYKTNFKDSVISGDITKIKASNIPDFDFLLAGFPCQPFSSAGSRRGFMDTRGTLFFDIERILKEKQPYGFILENVEGLKTHDRIDPKKPIGRTLETILQHLEELGYKVSWKVLDASLYGVPQRRKRIYIVGTKDKFIDLDDMPAKPSKLADILQFNPSNAIYVDSNFTKKLFEHFKPNELIGKQIKDKRGGENNIHSWDIELKGSVSTEQKQLIEELLKQRRRKSWASHKGIEWSDGMPLTLDEIKSFYQSSLPLFDKSHELKNIELEEMLEDLVEKGYLVKERPKKANDNYQHEGYNIVAGKLSFEISNILDPENVTPTLVATDVTRLAIVDSNKLRRLTVREGLRLFGFPESYQLDNIVNYKEAFDLLGNSVCVGMIEIVSDKLFKSLYQQKTNKILEPRQTIRQHKTNLDTVPMFL